MERTNWFFSTVSTGKYGCWLRPCQNSLTMEELKKCDYDKCGNEEFLVWRCDNCAKNYCEAHKKPSLHNCPAITSDISRANTENTVSVQDIFCAIETRHDTDDRLSGKVHANVKSSIVKKDERMETTLTKVEQMDKVIDDSKCEKQRSIARKTKTTLLRTRAVGNSSTPPDERIYVMCFFTLSSTWKCFFFSTQTTVGSALQYIGDKETLLAYGAPVKPDALTLYFTHGDSTVVAHSNCHERCLYRWRMDSLLNMNIEHDFVELGVQVVSLSESADIQCSLEQQMQTSEHADESTGGPSCEYEKGDRIVYKRGEVGVVVGVHTDEAPPYYTIQLSDKSGNVKEKQTVGNNLVMYSDPSDESSGASFLGEKARGEVFSIRLSSGGKVRQVDNVPVDGTVFDLKKIISMYTGVLPAKQKLLVKGKVIKDDNMKLQQPSLTKKKAFVLGSNSLVMLMTMSN